MDRLTVILLSMSAVLLILIGVVFKDMRRGSVIEAEYRELCIINGYPNLAIIRDGKFHFYQSYHKKYFCKKIENQTDKVIPVLELNPKPQEELGDDGE